MSEEKLPLADAAACWQIVENASIAVQPNAPADKRYRVAIAYGCVGEHYIYAPTLTSACMQLKQWMESKGWKSRYEPTLDVLRKHQADLIAKIKMDAALEAQQ